MRFCTGCGQSADDGDRFCRACGVAIAPTEAPTEAPSAPRRMRPWVIVLALLQVVAVVVLIAFLSTSKGCSTTTGSFVSVGKPLGDFTFVPASCKSGQRMSFFGAVLLGEGPGSGAVVLVQDPVQGQLIKVELPGSCKGPNYDVCTEVIVRREQCKVFDATVERTSTEVNDIVLIDGHLRLDCTFPDGGGTAKADITFTSCD